MSNIIDLVRLNVPPLCSMSGCLVTCHDLVGSQAGTKDRHSDQVLRN